MRNRPSTRAAALEVLLVIALAIGAIGAVRGWFSAAPAEALEHGRYQ